MKKIFRVEIDQHESLGFKKTEPSNVTILSSIKEGLENRYNGYVGDITVKRLKR